MGCSGGSIQLPWKFFCNMRNRVDLGQGDVRGKKPEGRIVNNTPALLIDIARNSALPRIDEQNRPRFRVGNGNNAILLIHGDTQQLPS